MLAAIVSIVEMNSRSNPKNYDFCHQLIAGGLMPPEITEPISSGKSLENYQPWLA
jgi:hypothetical protein